MSIITPPITSLHRIAFLVGAMHFVILVGSIWQIKHSSQKTSTTRLVVHTIASPPVPPTSDAQEAAPSPSIQEVSPPLQKTTSMQEQEVAQPKTQEKDVKKIAQEAKRPETPIVKKEKEKTKETKVESKGETKIETKKEKAEKKERKPIEKKAPSLDKKLLKELEQELQEAKALDTHAPVINTSNPSLPQLSNKVPTTATSPLSSQTEENYISQLKQHLQDTLRLPDIGEITIGLRLTPQGKVAHIEVLKKTSALNERYVLDQIPQLSFPAWGNGSEERYFPITLRSK